MQFNIQQKAGKKSILHIIDDVQQLAQIDGLEEKEIKYCKSIFKDQSSTATINKYDRYYFILLLKDKKEAYQSYEACRKSGAEYQSVFNSLKLAEVVINNLSKLANAGYLVAEGIALANYQFLKYFADADKKKNSLETISFTKQSITVKELNELATIVAATYKARDLVNEPLSYLTATQLAKEIAAIGKEANFKVTTLTKAQIEKEKMGGLLAVNKGSIQPPTFTVMEYKPKKSLNKKPIVLVGKGVVYDTGGLSLKPTAASMDRMKSDMGGSALVTAATYAIAKLQLPLHIITLVPATDNRPGQDAYVPGDVIKMYSGSTVEVLNTDAEGRMLLADALHWAKRYDPELVLDFATLTGAAAVAVGDVGIVCMGTADADTKDSFQKSGFNQYERLVEYPLWDEYRDMLKSDIADLKNIGGRYGGAITAGKFLEHFTNYPWMHFDIAGVSFATGKKNYTTTGGTAYGLRMLLDFFIHYGIA